MRRVTRSPRGARGSTTFVLDLIESEIPSNRFFSVSFSFRPSFSSVPKSVRFGSDGWGSNQESDRMGSKPKPDKKQQLKVG